MPIYVYARRADAKSAGCDMCSGQFEIQQRMSDEALLRCPQCSSEVERVITAPHLNGVGPIKKPSDERMARAGFTQYKKHGKGYYEKSFGKGPDALHPGSDN